METFSTTRVSLHLFSLVLSIAACILLNVSCQQNLYEPAGFKAACAQIKQNNSALNLGWFDGVKFVAMDREDRALSDFEAISIGCNGACFRAMASGAGPLLVEYNSTYFERYYAYRQRPKYLSSFLENGVYKYEIRHIKKCETLASKIATGTYGFENEGEIESCVTISKAENLHDIVTAQFLPNDVSGKIEFTKVMFSRHGQVIGSYENGFFSYPPGPSIEMCIQEPEYTAGFNALMKSAHR